MTAKITIPSATLFEKLLIVSGLKKVPIRDGIVEAAFISHVQAASVRGVALETGIVCSPLMLNEPQDCRTCSQPVLMFVQPQNVCFDCWPDSLDIN
jgi:hypothetical protein